MRHCCKPKPWKSWGYFVKVLRIVLQSNRIEAAQLLLSSPTASLQELRPLWEERSAAVEVPVACRAVTPRGARLCAAVEVNWPQRATKAHRLVSAQLKCL